MWYEMLINVSKLIIRDHVLINKDVILIAMDKLHTLTSKSTTDVREIHHRMIVPCV